MLRGSPLVGMNLGAQWLSERVELRKENPLLGQIPRETRHIYAHVLQPQWIRHEDAHRILVPKLRQEARHRNLSIVEVTWKEQKGPDSYELGVLAVPRIRIQALPIPLVETTALPEGVAMVMMPPWQEGEGLEEHAARAVVVKESP